MPDQSEYLARIAESLDLLLKLALERAQGDRPQREMVLYLDSQGVSGARIAELLNTTTNSVYPVLSRARAAKKKKTKKKAPSKESGSET